MGTGTLEARTKAILSPRISGRLTEVSADQGDEVEAGRVMMRLDDSELKQQVEMAKVSIAAAKAALNRFEADKTLSLRGLKPATDLRVKTGQGFDELKLLFPGFCGVFFDQTRCAGLAGFECG